MSNSESTQRIVITGSSSGFGLLTAKSLLTLGYEVVATMRDSTTRNASKAAQLRAFSADTSGELTVVELDVTSDTSVASAAEQIRELGLVDVLVNNAGVMNIGITEAYSIDEVQAQFEVNTFGPARVAKAFIPQMREQKSGLIINLSSVLGRLNLPFFGVYCASKFALEALFEAYRYELAAFGVDCIIVEPGPYGSASALLAKSPAPRSRPKAGVKGAGRRFCFETAKSSKGKDLRPCLHEYHRPIVFAPRSTSCSPRIVSCPRSWRRWPGSAHSC